MVNFLNILYRSTFLFLIVEFLKHINRETSTQLYDPYFFDWFDTLSKEEQDKFIKDTYDKEF